MKHDFHMLLTINEKESVKGFSKMNNMSFTNAVCYMIEHCGFYIRFYYEKLIQLESRQSIIPEKVDAHFYFEKEYFIELKRLHGRYNLYGIAEFIIVCHLV